MFFLGPLKAQSKYSVLMPHQILKVQSALTLTLSLCFSVTGNSNQSLHLLFYANLSQHPLDLMSFAGHISSVIPTPEDIEQP